MVALPVLWLAACGRPVEAPSSPGEFPHPPRYEEDGHGLDAVQPDAACASCHGETGPGEACAECHPSYPHPADYVRGAAHGPEWSADCEACHGSQGQRVPAEVTAGACAHCHSTFPHPARYADVDAHGAAVLARGTVLACTSGCHPAGSEGDCAACHDSFPHGPDMVSTHGEAWVAGSRDCESCHEPGRAAPSCEGCHAGVPHPDDWSAVGHLVAVQARGEGTCRDCHPEGTLAGPALPVSCGADCHGEGP